MANKHIYKRLYISHDTRYHLNVELKNTGVDTRYQFNVELTSNEVGPERRLRANEPKLGEDFTRVIRSKTRLVDFCREHDIAAK
jgi:hypothetical protein